MLRTYIFCIVAAAFLASFLSVGSDREADLPSKDGREALMVSTRSDSAGGEGDQGGNGEAVAISRSVDGHFYADITINGTPVKILVDTGATGIALTRDDARKVGLAVSPRMAQVIGRGASGDVRGEYVELERVTLGLRSAENMPAVVLDSGSQSLLGQSFLSQFDSVEIQGDRMLLR